MARVVGALATFVVAFVLGGLLAARLGFGDALALRPLFQSAELALAGPKPPDRAAETHAGEQDGQDVDERSVFARTSGAAREGDEAGGDPDARYCQEKFDSTRRVTRPVRHAPNLPLTENELAMLSGIREGEHASVPR
jgi:hypothetical protein